MTEAKSGEEVLVIPSDEANIFFKSDVARTDIEFFDKKLRKKLYIELK